MATLFVGSDNTEYTEKDFFNILKKIGADNCEHLFIHSDIMFGRLGKGLRRSDLLSALYECIDKLNVSSLIIPTFTYSFCNNEDFNVLTSRTSMGAFNEYIRKLNGRYRTYDPLLSLSVSENLKDYFSVECDNSLGEKSGLDLIHKLDNVKFLFFGVRMGCCFTYVHYIEKMLNVPYRFDMKFQGKIFDEKGNIREKTQYIHTACGGIKPAEFYYFEDELEEKGYLKKQFIADSQISCIDETVAYRMIKEKLEKDINYFLEKPFTQADLTHKYTMSTANGRITHC